MCGILWIRRLDGKPVLKQLHKQYKSQAHRGNKGYGFIAITRNKIFPLVRTQTESEIMKELQSVQVPEILFHHRFPTSSPNTPEGAHPIPVKNEKLKYDYYVIHNGAITNDDELKNNHNKKGFIYTSEVQEGVYVAGKFYSNQPKITKFNDTEALAIDLALCIENDAKKTEAYGGIAFMMLQVDKKTQKPIKMFYGHNDQNPLKIDVTNTYMKIASEGSGIDVEPHKLHSIDYITGEIKTERDFEIGFKFVTRVYQPIDYKNSHYDHDTNQWVPNKKDMGYDVTAKQDQLPEPKKVTIRDADPDNEFDYDIDDSIYDPIPGYEDTGLPIKLSSGSMLYFFIADLEHDYVNLLEESALWQDKILNEQDPQRLLEYRSILSIVEQDELVYRAACKELWPFLFTEQHDRSTSPEPII